MLKTSRYYLRPLVSAQQERFISTATFIDGYLYLHDGKLCFVLELRAPRAGNERNPSALVHYAIERDCFGLFVDRKLYAAPATLGVSVKVDDLKQLSGVQRGQLRRLLVLLAMSVRASLYRDSAPRFSVKLHCLTPRPCDPLEGLRNHYAASGRAARDMELARRAVEKRARAGADGVTKRPSSWPANGA